ncbi:MAG TPA: metal-dependent hydrolase [Actinocrinis sp.]|uniref:metal-dependent hydrolase n=1 Tax=Actinocrinis sp. TaxID=1920516 RepID=UPI002DDD1839|nr:metal-dependent hydrolase [Actinocrinis sp.]HEV2346213.1 metal-dependent hydrolase [Actinocrinis sp.]
MAYPNTATLVTFPSGTVHGGSTVVAAMPLPGGVVGLVTDTTPFHPLDHSWPDQPGDSGTVEFDTVDADTGEFRGARYPVVDCVIGAVSPQGEFLLGEEIPVRRGDPEWVWLVVHLAELREMDEAGAAAQELVGRAVVLRADVERRAALSAAHTGCHLLALALNEALAERWRKQARSDALGSPDFDALAMVSSRMDEHASTDRYRIGKSLRKQGFDPEGLGDALAGVTTRVNARLAGWIAADAPVRVEAPGPELTARRRWVCELPEGTASIDCGGTHVARLGELSSLTTSLSLSGDGTELVAVTVPKRT